MPINASSTRIAAEHMVFAVRDISNSYQSVLDTGFGRRRFASREAYMTGSSMVTNELHRRVSKPAARNFADSCRRV
jgi:hypothetical protein